MADEPIKRAKGSRKSVKLDAVIVQGGVEIEAGKPVSLYPDQIETLKAQGIDSSPAPSGKGG